MTSLARICLLMLILTAVLLAACAERITPYQVEEPTDLQARVYYCPGGYEFAVRYQGEDVIVHLPGRQVLLPRVAAASGEKFSNGRVTFWAKGDRAMLETPAQTHTGCTVSAGGMDRNPTGNDHPQFSAAGRSPAWTLEISPISMTLTTDSGRERYVFPAPFVDQDADPGRRVYRVEARGQEATVVITDNDCRNALDGRTYEKSVTVTLDDGRTFAGCGTSK